MEASEAIEVLKRAFKLAHDDHVSRLLALPQPYLESIRPNKGLPLQEILKNYNSEVAGELQRYGKQLQSEVVRVLEKAKSNSNPLSRHEIMSLVKSYLQPDLYRKRFDLLVDAIERRISGFGVPFDMKDYRVDIPQSLSSVEAENGCKRWTPFIGQRIAVRK